MNHWTCGSIVQRELAMVGIAVKHRREPGDQDEVHELVVMKDASEADLKVTSRQLGIRLILETKCRDADLWTESFKYQRESGEEIEVSRVLVLLPKVDGKQTPPTS